MATKKGAAARTWLDDGTYPMWTGFIAKGWREIHCNMEIHQVVTTTRNIRRAMEEGRGKMWTARCDSVYRVDDEETRYRRGSGRTQNYRIFGYGWTGQETGSGLSDRPRGVLGQIHF
jgi:hypothetical protein